jgi:hypothetical protein
MGRDHDNAFVLRYIKLAYVEIHVAVVVFNVLVGGGDRGKMTRSRGLSESELPNELLCVRRQSEHPLRPNEDAHRSNIRSGRAESLTITHRTTMATTMDLSKLPWLAVTTAILLPQESSHRDKSSS